MKYAHVLGLIYFPVFMSSVSSGAMLCIYIYFSGKCPDANEVTLGDIGI